MDGNTELILKRKADIFKALGHPTRLWIAEQLIEGESCVCEFIKELNFDFSTVSKHLSVLKNAGIIEDEKRGRKVFYRLKIPCLINFVNCAEEAVRTKARDESLLISACTN